MGHNPFANLPYAHAQRDIILREVEAITLRRKQVGLADTAPVAGGSKPEIVGPPTFEEDLIGQQLFGLSLSGGGLRSAMFNLGLLQALHGRGLLKYMDYVSAVSGGSYIAGYLTASAVAHTNAGGRNFHTWNENPFATDNGGKLREPSRTFQYGGTYLLKPLEFTGGYLIGLLLVHATILSLLIAICSAVAIVWRSFDHPWLRDRLVLLNWNHDLFVAFYPTVGFLIAWLAVVALTHFTAERWPIFTRGCRNWALFALGTSALIGFMILLGNGIQGGPDWLLRQDLTFQQFLRGPLATVIPLMVPVLLFFGRQLMSSAQQPTDTWFRWFFWLVSRLVVLGIPLFLVGFIAQENISGYATVRGPELIRQDIKDWDGFLVLLTDLQRQPNLVNREPLVSQTLCELECELADTEQCRHEVDGPTPMEHLNGKEASAFVSRLGGVVGSMLDSCPVIGGSWGGDVTRYLDRKQRLETTVQQKRVEQFNGNVLGHQALTDYLLARLNCESGGAEEFVRSQAKTMADGNELTDLWAIQHELGEWPSHWDNPLPGGWTTRKKFNRLLLEILFPSVIRHRTEISTPTVIGYDQQARLVWCLLPASLIALVGILLLDTNLSSLHGFYRDRLRSMFIYRGHRAANPAARPRDPTLWECRTAVAVGAPYFLIGGALRLLGPSRNEDQRMVYPFLFSPLYCGSPVTGWAPTEQYRADRNGRGRLTLSEAVAISGAAVSPTLTSDYYAAFFMLLLNLRLGIWLPPVQRANAWRHVQSGYLLWQWLRGLPEGHKYCLVADGGIDEFLGVEELLIRRCRLIVVSDAGANEGPSEFGVLAGAIRRARVDHGIRIVNLADDAPLNLDDLRRDSKNENRSKKHFVCGRIIYPERDADGKNLQGLLVYVQMTIVGDEEVDLQYFKATHKSFPNDSIFNQFFDEDQVEAYRQLGYHSGEVLCNPFDGSLTQTPLLAHQQILDCLEGAAQYQDREGPAAISTDREPRGSIARNPKQEEELASTPVPKKG